MNTIDNELSKNGIHVVGPIDQKNVNDISMFVAKTLYYKFPDLKLNFKSIYSRIASLKMYIADMTTNSGASYYYKNSSIYFQKGISLVEIKKLAVHECIHYLQEIKDVNGNLTRLGLCTYYRNRAYGNALNEAAVQLMSSYATEEKRDVVTYYGITLPTDSPSYYPLLCNLIKQVGYLTGFGVLFESTLYSNDAFFDKFKSTFGEKNAYKIQRNLEKILINEEIIIKTNNKIQNKEMSYFGFKNCTDRVDKCKNEIQKIFISTQNLIISSFFDSRITKLESVNQIENYRKYLYSFSNLIGTTNDYTFFNDYYISKMSALDDIYEKRDNPDVSLVEVKPSKLSKLFGFFKKIFAGNNELQIQTQTQTDNNMNIKK